MRKRYAFKVICTITAGGLMLGCFDTATETTSTSTTASSSEYTTILENYSQKVVVATYADMKNSAGVLHTMVEAFVANPDSQALLDSAGGAWKAVRTPWEASEAFLFGPAAFMGLDPALDSWPVDRQQLNDVLASDLTLDEASVDLLGPVVKGFHTIEYLLFREGAVRTADSLTARERDYLAAVSGILADNTEQLWAAWATGEYEGGTGTPYAKELAKAGSAGSRYMTPADGVSEVIEGMMVICDEVANGKIADPANENDVTLVESQFSWNSLRDFQDNMRSVRNSYTGAYHKSGESATYGLSDYVKTVDADLDTRILSAIDDAIQAIGAIPYPFRDNLTDAGVTTAIDKCNAVLETLDKELKPIIL